MEYHVSYMNGDRVIKANSLKEARIHCKRIHQENPEEIVDITGPWYPFRVPGIKGECLCSSKSEAEAMNKLNKERIKNK